MITDTFEVHHTPPPLSFATFKLFSLFYYNNYKVHSTKMIMCTLDLISFIISYFQPNRLQFSVLCLSYPTRRIISRMPRQEINDVTRDIQAWGHGVKKTTNFNLLLIVRVPILPLHRQYCTLCNATFLYLLPLHRQYCAK